MPETSPPLPRARESADRAEDVAPPEYDLSYRDAFWLDRDYEDRCDRIALRALLPPRGQRLLDLGAGFGRLADEYSAFDDVTLVDASRPMLDAARARLRADPRMTFVEADAMDLPFADGEFDTVVAVRLLVHFRDPEPIFREARRVLRPGGSFIVEYPNRRHLLAVLRHVTRRQRWSPTGLAAHEYLPAHFAHQPKTVEKQLHSVGLKPSGRRAVSLFRLAPVKRLVPARVLAAIESPLQGPLGGLDPGPSVFVRAVRVDPVATGSMRDSRVPCRSRDLPSP